MDKAFHWSDLTGSGRNWLISGEQLLQTSTQDQHLFGERLGIQPPFYNHPTSLKFFVESAVQGQEWYDQCDSYTCIGTIEQVKNQLHI
jgi:hypothetical protein